MSIKVKRGLAINLPTLEEGELGFTTDSYEMYVGSDNGNILLNNGEILIRRNNGMLQYAQSSRKNQWFDICSLEEIRGDRGIQGIQGIQGVKGDKGDKGERGIQGEKGNPFTYADFTPDQLRALKGEKGDTGAKGERGLTGDKGDRGVGLNYTWSGTRLGVKRDTDAQYTYVDLRGADGKDGKQGERGERGIQGEKGDTPSITHLEKQISDKSKELDTKFNTLTAKQQQDAEVINARDGEVSLNARLERDLEKGKIHFVDIEGSNISTESEEGYLENVEIHGNTWQDANNLSDIRSVGTKVEGQELYEIPVLSVGKNLYKHTKNTQVVNGVTYTFNDDGTIQASGTAVNYNAYLELCNSEVFPLIGTYTFSGTSGVNINGSYYNCPKTHNFTSSDSYRFYVTTGVGNANSSLYKPQIEEGTQATPYEPYQEDRLTILSPTPLEKVGNVADRIVCKDGVYGVEKNIKETTLQNSNIKVDNWNNSDDTKSCLFKAEDVYIVDIHNIGVISNKLKGDTYDNLYKKTSNNSISTCGGYSFAIRVANETLNGLTLKEYLDRNNIKVKYITTQSTFVPLPHDQQIKLRTFANKTHISFDTEIEPTLKAQVPKSLGATVNTHTTQIDSLNKELDRVKKLEESTVSTVTSDKAFTTVAETTAGYFEDVKLEGKTLVNLAKVINRNQLKKWNTIAKSIMELQINKDYTFILINNSNATLPMYTNGFTNTGVFNLKPNEIKVMTRVCANESVKTSILTSYSDEVTDYAIDVILLEGDHADKDITFFEGLKSVGQDTNEMSVLSVSDTIFVKDVDGTHDTKPIYLFYNVGTTVLGEYLQYFNEVDAFHKCNSMFDYYYNGASIWINLGSFDRKEALINLNYKIAEINGRANKKQILYYNPNTQTWEKPVLREWDSIEKHSDGKYYYHKRSGEIVLNGSETWRGLEVSDTHIKTYTTVNNILTRSELLCNKFTYYLNDIPGVWGFEGITSVNSTYGIIINIQESKLNEKTILGFKQWLQANPTTVVYQLAQEEVYECTNLDLITYPNETNLIVNSGAIQPKLTLKVLSNVSNVVKLLQEKVSVLENKFINGLKQVLAGDMMSLAHLLYPEDFALENDTPQVIPYIEEGDINE